jgi:hypothetical protein
MLLTMWRLTQDFHVIQDAVDIPFSGDTSPTALLQQPQGWGNPLSLWLTAN